ncbi:MAG: DUF2461 domain-containing protein [Saprospiraceae bacterium]|nr:DUF2461 domain-containing protein [Saprospiraceae bacterium]
MITKNTLQFLADLKAHNERDWFTANKTRYEAAHKEFLTFTDALIAEISKFDPKVMHYTAKDCVFRIYRDVRFSKDKSPYKTHFGAHVTPAAKKSEIHTRAGYYIHLEPDGASFLAGGAYLPEAVWLKAIRQEIAYNTTEFMGIIQEKEFKKYFGEIEGEKLKTTPKDYPADHPAIELLKHKSFLASSKCTDAQVTSPDFLKHCAAAFRALNPFDQFLNRSTD